MSFIVCFLVFLYYFFIFGFYFLIACVLMLVYVNTLFIIKYRKSTYTEIQTLFNMIGTY